MFHVEANALVVFTAVASNIYCTESENGALSSLESFNTRSVLVSKT